MDERTEFLRVLAKSQHSVWSRYAQDALDDAGIQPDELYLLVKKFNPDQLRGPDGRWTRVGAEARRAVRAIALQYVAQTEVYGRTEPVKVWQPVPPDTMGYASPPLDPVTAAAVAAAPLPVPARAPIA
jgi:hypothetical protein